MVELTLLSDPIDLALWSNRLWTVVESNRAVVESTVSLLIITSTKTSLMEILCSHCRCYKRVSLAP